MKRMLLTLAFAAVSHAAAAADAASVAPLMGTWAVDVSRLPMPSQARPQRVTITFSSESGGRLGTRVEVVDPTGARLQAEGVTPLDGTPTAVRSNFEADVSATTMPTPEVLIMQLGKGGIPASTRVYTVLADPNLMTETVAYFGPDGQPVLRKNHFSRVR